MALPIGVNLSSKPFSISFPASGWKCVLRGSASEADKLRRQPTDHRSHAEHGNQLYIDVLQKLFKLVLLQQFSAI